jgi:hypothetical protein
MFKFTKFCVKDLVIIGAPHREFLDYAQDKLFVSAYLLGNALDIKN